MSTKDQYWATHTWSYAPVSLFFFFVFCFFFFFCCFFCFCFFFLSSSCKVGYPQPWLLKEANLCCISSCFPIWFLVAFLKSVIYISTIRTAPVCGTLTTKADTTGKPSHRSESTYTGSPAMRGHITIQTESQKNLKTYAHYNNVFPFSRKLRFPIFL